MPIFGQKADSKQFSDIRSILKHPPVTTNTMGIDPYGQSSPNFQEHLYHKNLPESPITSQINATERFGKYQGIYRQKPDFHDQSGDSPDTLPSDLMHGYLSPTSWLNPTQNIKTHTPQTANQNLEHLLYL